MSDDLNKTIRRWPDEAMVDLANRTAAPMVLPDGEKRVEIENGMVFLYVDDALAMSMPEETYRELLKGDSGTMKEQETNTAGVSIDTVRKFVQVTKKADRILDQRLEVAGAQPSCKTGCAACCYHLVPATFPEALFALSKAIATGHRKLVATPGKVKLMFKSAHQANEMRNDNAKWLQKRRPCIFLTKQNKCAAYDARPVTCRTYVNLANPDDCYSKDKMIEISDAASIAADETQLELSAIAEDLNRPQERRTLQEWLPIAAVSLGLSEPDTRERVQRAERLDRVTIGTTKHR